MSSPQITYLFGAGASANSTPLQSALYTDMQHVLAGLHHAYSGGSWNIDFESINSKRVLELSDLDQKSVDILGDILQVTRHAARYKSVDIYAKILHNSEKDNELLLLKRGVSIYFAIKENAFALYDLLRSDATNKDQDRRQDWDPRYDELLTLFSSRSMAWIDPRVKLWTWNYDTELERSIARVIADSSPTELLRHGYITQSVRHLNGRALPQYGYDRNFNLKLQICHQQTEIEYAWSSKQKHIVEWSDTINNTEIFVVVGYSFPFFNNNIDKEIFSGKSLKKIYLQGPQESLANMEASVRSLLGERGKLEQNVLYANVSNNRPERIEFLGDPRSEIEIVRIPSTQSFYVPNELR